MIAPELTLTIAATRRPHLGETEILRPAGAGGARLVARRATGLRKMETEAHGRTLANKR